MSTEPLFVPALASLDDLVPHEGLLTPDELEDIAREIADAHGLWEPLVHADAERRRYELVYEDDRMDAWILSWMPGQGTGFHDHYISGVGLCVASGCVQEDLMVYGRAPQSRSCRPATRARAAPATSIASRTTRACPAVTVHVYSPGSTGSASTGSARTASSSARCGPAATSSRSS